MEKAPAELDAKLGYEKSEKISNNDEKGAKNSTVTFSLIETAKASGIDPYKYLVYIFKTAPTLSSTDEDWANKLLPEHFKTAY